MRIGITQRPYEINGVMHDCLDPTWYTFFAPHELVAIPNIKNIELSSTIDMIDFTGEEISRDRTAVESHCFNFAAKRKLPMLGICHGALFLNYIFGGINQEIKGHRNTEHTILIDSKVVTVNSFHDYALDELGSALHPIARAKDKSIEAFKHNTLPIWGIMWHPERMDKPALPPGVWRLLNQRS